jgi:HD-like signal output (HDOD) protein
MPDHPAPAISVAPPSLNAWAERLRSLPIPVLAETAAELEALREVEDDVDAQMLAEAICEDPLMSLKLLAHVGRLGSARDATAPETVTAALVWLGIGPFFRAFAPQPTVEQHLAGSDAALQGLRDVLKRAHRAAAFALAFAVHRMDGDAQVIHAAALLHDFAEMLLWLHAPKLALELAARQHDQPTLRSALAQRQLLNIELVDLQQTLLRGWQLPQLLVRINDERHAEAPEVRNVLLAVRLARHTALDWDNPALADDVRDIAALLNLAETPTRKLLAQIDG